MGASEPAVSWAIIILKPCERILSNPYPIIQAPVQAKFLERINRFACHVDLDGSRVKVYLPNSGRLEELLRPGTKVVMERRRESGKTHHDLLLSQSPRFPDGRPIWVGLDSRLPQRLLRHVVENRLSHHFGQPTEIRNEPRAGVGRFDLSFHDHQGHHLVETKSVNLLDNSGMARFPDAPTARGSRHIEELISYKAQDIHPWLIFIVMRSDAKNFSPFAERDPGFAQILQQAKDEGLNVLALMFEAGTEMTFLGELEVILPPPPFGGIWPQTA